MSKLGEFSERTLELVEKAGGKLQITGVQAGKWLQTGAVLGAVRTGTKVATRFARRNPVAAVAIAAGAGVLALAAYRRRKREALNAPIEGKSRRIEARKVNGTGKSGGGAATKTTARKPRSRKPPSAPSAET